MDIKKGQTHSELYLEFKKLSGDFDDKDHGLPIMISKDSSHYLFLWKEEEEDKYKLYKK